MKKIALLIYAIINIGCHMKIKSIDFLLLNIRVKKIKIV